MRQKEYTVLPKDKNASFFVHNKLFYKNFFSLLIIIVLQQFAALMVNLVDNVMLGRYTELALNGATLVNQIQFTLQQLVAGIGLGIVVLASQYWGKGEIHPIRKIISIGVKFGLAVGVIFCVVALVAGRQLLGIFTTDSQIIEEGLRYLHIMAFTYVIFGLSNALMYSLQAVETVFIGTIMSVSTIFINLILNYILIYGNLGAPELGIRGAAIATITSRSVELVIIFFYLFKVDKKLKMKVKELFLLDRQLLRDYFKIATPMMLSGILWGVAQAAQTAILGHVSASALAANSIASIIYQIFVVVGLACGNTASVVIGKTIGQGKLQLLRSYSRTMQIIFLFIGVGSSALMFVFKDLIVNFYTVSPEAKELALQFLIILCVAMIGSCYQYPVSYGIVAGGGSTKYPPLVDNLFMWLFTIPSAALAAFVFGAPPAIIFCCLKADQILKCICNGIACNRYRWVKVLTHK